MEKNKKPQEIKLTVKADQRLQALILAHHPASCRSMSSVSQSRDLVARNAA